MIFGKVIREVMYTLFPFYIELCLCYSVPKRIVSHTTTLGSLDSHFHMDKTVCGGIVGDNFGLFLWVTQSFQGITNADCNGAVVEEGYTFRFCG